MSVGPHPLRVLITGGARSGKSAEAERRLLQEPAVTYVATGPVRPEDSEWTARVALHQARRPAHWTTIETTDVASLLREPGEPVLVDCLALWLDATMDAAGVWQDRPGCDEELTARVDALVDSWRLSVRQVVAVTNEVGSGIHPDTVSGRRYRDELGRLNTRLAAVADEVWLIVVGRSLRLL